MIKNFAEKVGIVTKNKLTTGPITYNDIENTYHPHFHAIVDGKENAETLVKEWLIRNPNSESWCQNIRSLDSGGLMELFKYTTKIVSKSKRDGFVIYVKALDVIFQSVHGLRTFQSFGKVRMINEDIDELKAETYDIPYYESVVWQWKENDWYSILHGDALTGYQPSDKMIQLTTEKMQI